MDEQESYLYFIRKDVEALQYLHDDQFMTADQKQKNAIYDIVKQLSIIPDDDLHKNVEMFIKEHDRITGEINKYKDIVTKLLQEEHENYKNMYENVLKKL